MSLGSSCVPGKDWKRHCEMGCTDVHAIGKSTYYAGSVKDMVEVESFMKREKLKAMVTMKKGIKGEGRVSRLK